MPWKPDRLSPLDLSAPANWGSEDPRGDRLRLRLNLERGRVVDFVIQYETPRLGAGQGHHEVVRYDGSHGEAHFPVFDRFGNEMRRGSFSGMSYNDTVQTALTDLRQHWKDYREAFRRGKP